MSVNGGIRFGLVGRGPQGRIRNARAMLAPKLERVYDQILREGQDPEAFRVFAHEMRERGYLTYDDYTLDREGFGTLSQNIPIRPETTDEIDELLARLAG